MAPFSDEALQQVATDAAVLVGINVALWLLSLFLHNTAAVDFIWSNFPIAQAAAIYARSTDVAVCGRAVLVVSLVSLWGCRLTLNFVSRGGIGHEDWRYGEITRRALRLW